MTLPDPSFAAPGLVIIRKDGRIVGQGDFARPIVDFFIALRRELVEAGTVAAEAAATATAAQTTVTNLTEVVTNVSNTVTTINNTTAPQTPTTVLASSSFEVQADCQVLFVLPITLEGNMILNGDLVQV